RPLGRRPPPALPASDVFCAARATDRRLFRALGAVAAAGLAAAVNGGAVERSADDLVAHTGEVPHTAATDEHHRVLLQVVADARDVGGHFHAVDQAHAADLAKRRVRFLGRGGVHARAHAALLRVALERRRLLLVDRLLAALTDQLVNSRQSSTPLTRLFDCLY